MERIESILKQYWGYDDFRGIQREIIESILCGHDTLGLMPTGGGKSITFQVPAMAQEGTCIVITPLIALMTDQVQNLQSRGIRAAAIHSGLSHDDIIKTLENAIFGGTKLLYVSPERLSSEIFLKKLSHMKVSFVCIDEAHCICQWGYDFRPSYLEIKKIRKILPDAPVLALTATATPDVVDDIQQQLCFKERRVFRMSFERKNLAYIVRETADKESQLIHILSNTQGSAIVYARSRNRTKEIAEMLSSNGLNATFFHAGLDTATKMQRQKEWKEDKTRIMVATNAFGMGIDKPDVRIVLHIDCPDSIEAYFQEAGRAGRDGEKAFAVLLYNGHDKVKLEKRIVDTFPDKEAIKLVYDHLAYFYQVGIGSGYNATFEFPIDKFCHNFRHYPIQVQSALKILDRAGYIEYKEEEENRARVMFTLERDELYRLHNNSPQEDALIVALLRNYSGLFNDFRFIDESLLAQDTGLTVPQVYMLLKELGHKRIINFIPQKKTSYIRYKQRREESKHLLFPPAIYDNLKVRYTERIHHMTDYATTGNKCRSRQLLAYFGEKTTADCGQCDVCLERKKAEGEKETITSTREMIINLLSDHEAHFIKSIYKLSTPTEAIKKALQELLCEGRISLDGVNISLNA